MNKLPTKNALNVDIHDILIHFMNGLSIFSVKDTVGDQNYLLLILITMHKNQPHVCKIPGRPRPGAVESLGCDPERVPLHK